MGTLIHVDMYWRTEQLEGNNYLGYADYNTVF